MFSSVCLSPSLNVDEMSRTKIRHVAFYAGFAYLTDMNLGCVFIVRVWDLGETGSAGRNRKVRLDRPMGVCVDPTSGDVAVASLSAPGAVELFDHEGYYLKSVKLRGTLDPSDVVVDATDGAVYVVDFKNRLVQAYNRVRRCIKPLPA